MSLLRFMTGLFFASFAFASPVQFAAGENDGAGSTRFVIPSKTPSTAADTLDVFDVPFRFVPAEMVSAVFLTGDFNRWDRSADPMEGPDDEGAFTLAVRLAPGEYRYGFVTDGVPADGGTTVVAEGRFPRALNRRSDGRIDGDRLSLASGRTAVSRFDGDSISVTTRVHRNDVEKVSILFRRGDGDRLFPMRFTGDDGTFAYYRGEIAAPAATTGRIGIRLDDGGAPVFLTKEGVEEEASFARLLPVGPAKAPLVTFPGWALEQIQYHVVPDRFRNGNRKNDPARKNDRHGGDLEGVLEKLSSIAGLGINTLSFSPVQDSPSPDRFDGGNWRRVGSGIGGGDVFRVLVDEAHNRGLKVIVTVVLHSVSVEHRAWIDALARGRASEFSTWFEWKKWPVPAKFAAGDSPSNYYECVDGNGRRPWVSYDLSRPREEELGALRAPPVEWNRSLMAELDSTLAFYLVDMNVDGLIIDRPELLAPRLLPVIREKCGRLKREAYVVFDRHGRAGGRVDGDAIHATIHRREFLDPATSFLRAGGAGALRFDREIAARRGVTPLADTEGSVNLISSIDAGRFLTPGTDPRRLLLAHTLLLTARGIPRIHFGDEIGLAAGEDDRHPSYPWESAGEPARLAVRDQLKKLIALRRNHPALMRGEESTVFAAGDVLVKARYTSDDAVLVAVNAGEEEAILDIDGGSLPFAGDDPVELLGNAPLEKDEARPGWFTVRLGALGSTILHFPERR